MAQPLRPNGKRVYKKKNPDIPYKEEKNIRPCAASNSMGEPCGSWAITNSDYCMVHDPASKERMEKIRRSPKKPPPYLPIKDAEKEISSGQDVVDVLSSTICQVKAGQISTSIAMAVGSLCKVLIFALEKFGDQSGDISAKTDEELKKELGKLLRASKEKN